MQIFSKSWKLYPELTLEKSLISKIRYGEVVTDLSDVMLRSHFLGFSLLEPKQIKLRSVFLVYKLATWQLPVSSFTHNNHGDFERLIQYSDDGTHYDAKVDSSPE